MDFKTNPPDCPENTKTLSAVRNQEKAIKHKGGWSNLEISTLASSITVVVDVSVYSAPLGMCM